MEIKEFYLEDDIKRQLGYIIKLNRRKRLIELKNVTLIEKNPYTKENFCENNNICHYHTLTKLESDMIKEDKVYHILLKKLNLYFQVSQDEHKENMDFINKITEKMLYAGEYIDDALAKEIKNEIEQINFEKDIIAEYYLELLKIFINFQLLVKIDEDTIEMLLDIVDFYQGIHRGIALHCLGIYYLNRFDTEKAKEYFIEVREIYNDFDISKGLISSYLIAVYVYSNDYYHSVPLCNEMEEYYKERKNLKRLMHVYNYLSDYYFLINAHNVAKDYFNKAIEIIDTEHTLERFKYSIYYNWAYRCFKEFRFEEAIDSLKTSLDLCENNVNKIQIINLILITMTKLHFPNEETNEYIILGEKYFDYANEMNQNIFKYFRFKLNNNRYYRKFAFEKIIPLLTDDRSKNEILLFFYEDLYK